MYHSYLSANLPYRLLSIYIIKGHCESQCTLFTSKTLMLINIANYMTVYLFKNAILNLFLLVSHLYIFKLYQKEREIKSIRFYLFIFFFALLKIHAYVSRVWIISFSSKQWNYRPKTLSIINFSIVIFFDWYKDL